MIFEKLNMNYERICSILLSLTSHLQLMSLRVVAKGIFNIDSKVSATVAGQMTSKVTSVTAGRCCKGVQWLFSFFVVFIYKRGKFVTWVLKFKPHFEWKVKFKQGEHPVQQLSENPQINSHTNISTDSTIFSAMYLFCIMGDFFLLVLQNCAIKFHFQFCYLVQLTV